MKKNLLSVSIALMMSAAAFTSCVDNNESDSVKGIRDAKAEQLRSLAGMYKAQGEAELIRANFEKAFKDAQTALQLLENEEKSMANEIKKASLLHDIETAVAKAKAALAEALKIQASNEAALKVENDKVFGAALAGYNNAFAELYKGGRLSSKGLVNELNDANIELTRLKNDLVTVEKWIVGELGRLNENIAIAEAKKEVYSSLAPNDLEKLKAELAAIELEILKSTEINKGLNNVSDIAYETVSEKKDFIGLTYPDVEDKDDVTNIIYTNTYSLDVTWDYEYQCWVKIESILWRNVEYAQLTRFVYNPTYQLFGATYTKGGVEDRNGEFRQYVNHFVNRTSSPYVFAALNNPAFFKATEVYVKPIEFVLDAKSNVIINVGGEFYTKYELVDPEGYAKMIADEAKNIVESEKAKATAITAYNAAAAATKAAKTALVAAAEADKPAKEKLYKAAKLQSNIARLEMDAAVCQVDGSSNFIYLEGIYEVGNDPKLPTDVNSKIVLGALITAETVEGVYDTQTLVVRTVEVGSVNTVTTDVIYRVSGVADEGAKADLAETKAEYDMLVTTGLADYNKAIDEFLAANTAYAEAQKAVQIANYSYAMLEAKEQAIQTMVYRTADIPSEISRLEKDIADAKADIENIRNIDMTSSDNASAKEFAISIQEQNIANLEANISIEETLLKKFKAELDALIK